MEQIKRIEGTIYYGNIQCVDADEAYRRFRNDYHKLIGKAVYLRLDKLGRRTERVHGFGISRISNNLYTDFEYKKRARCWLLGLVCQSYWWAIEVPEMDDDLFDEWIEYALTKGTKAFQFMGLRKKSKGHKSKQ